MTHHNISITEARPDHIHQIGYLLNDEDRAEAQAMGYEPHKLLWKSYKGSLIRHTIFVNGEIAAIFGVNGIMMGLIGMPWLVTTAAARTVSPLIFSRIYRQYVKKMLTLFPVLEIWTDSRYIGAKRMLQLSGFKKDGGLGFYAAPDVPFERFMVRVQ